MTGIQSISIEMREKNPEEGARHKAVRKLVRAIIEQEGGNGNDTKRKIDADYRQGIVRYKDVRVGDYLDGKMELKGEAKKSEAQCQQLLS